MISKVQDIQSPNSLSVDDVGCSEYYNIQILPIRYLNIKIEILDENDFIINEVSGTAIDGSYNINADSKIRRTCNLSFYLKDGYLPTDKDSLFWINKKFRLYIGLESIDHTKVYWFNKGTYAINDPEINISTNNRTISISGLDKMALYTGDITGQLPYSSVATVDSGVSIQDTIKGIVSNAGENQIYIYDKKNVLQSTIPYDIESNIGEYTTDVLDKILELLANYQYYYDLDGNFIFAPKPLNNDFKSFPIEWDFKKDNSLIISIDRSLSYSNVKNRIIVLGSVHDDGFQPMHTEILDNSNEDFSDSPFTIDRLQEIYATKYSASVLEFTKYNKNGEEQVSYTSDTKDNCVKYNNNYYLCIRNTDNTKGTPEENPNDWEKIKVLDNIDNTITYQRYVFRDFVEQNDEYNDSILNFTKYDAENKNGLINYPTDICVKYSENENSNNDNVVCEIDTNKRMYNFKGIKFPSQCNNKQKIYIRIIAMSNIAIDGVNTIINSPHGDIAVNDVYVIGTPMVENINGISAHWIWGHNGTSTELSPDGSDSNGYYYKPLQSQSTHYDDSKLYASVDGINFTKLKWSINDTYIDTESGTNKIYPIMATDSTSGIAWGEYPYLKLVTSTLNYEDIMLQFNMGGTKKAPKFWKIQYSLDDKTYFDIGSSYYRCISESGTNNKIPPSENTNDWKEICSVSYLELIIDRVKENQEFAKIEFDRLMREIHAYSIQKCKQKTKELMFYHNFASDTVTITCVPIYSLDVNSVIYLDDEQSGASGWYVVQEISCSLGTNGTMTIKANKLYEETQEKKQK